MFLFVPLRCGSEILVHASPSGPRMANIGTIHYSEGIYNCKAMYVFLFLIRTNPIARKGKLSNVVGYETTAFFSQLCFM